jgi:hypothetical protein
MQSRTAQERNRPTVTGVSYTQEAVDAGVYAGRVTVCLILLNINITYFI